MVASRSRCIAKCIAAWYIEAVAQLVTRVDNDLADALDALVQEGAVASRSDGVRVALERLIDRHRRDRIGAQIVAGYLACPPTSDESGWSDEATAAMIAEEPW
jgi:metal-responsive CopG/Arc/MetJ family transcriptional regulator